MSDERDLVSELVLLARAIWYALNVVLLYFAWGFLLIHFLYHPLHVEYAKLAPNQPAESARPCDDLPAREL